MLYYLILKYYIYTHMFSHFCSPSSADLSRLCLANPRLRRVTALQRLLTVAARGLLSAFWGWEMVGKWWENGGKMAGKWGFTAIIMGIYGNYG